MANPQPNLNPNPNPDQVASLAFLNGQYYMQKVVANTAIKASSANPGC